MGIYCKILNEVLKYITLHKVVSTLKKMNFCVAVLWQFEMKIMTNDKTEFL